MYRTTFIKKAARMVSWVCGFLFTAFCVLYLYIMQADLLSTAQFLLSEGQTAYSPVWGTAVITVVLLLLVWLYRKVVTFPVRFHAFYYFPPCQFLGCLTSVTSADGWNVYMSFGISSLLVFILLYLAAVWMVMHFPDRSTEKHDMYAYLWPNFLFLSLFMLMTAYTGNTDEVYHYRLKMEREITDGCDSCVLATGRESLAADRNMTAMRMFALSRADLLGEQLFRYPQYYGSDGLMPAPSDTVHVYDWPSEWYKHVGGRPGRGIERAARFFELLSERPSATSAVKDYWLCACLLDKDLDAFAAVLPRFYTVNDSLPHYYKEALSLYGRLRTTPAIVYRNEAVETNMRDFFRYAAQFENETERANQCRRMYGHTYWWYYYYQPLRQQGSLQNAER